METRHDLLNVDHLLTDEERAIRDTARRFAQDKLEPHVAEWAETGELPARDIAKQMGGAGLLGMHLTGYGCAGASATGLPASSGRRSSGALRAKAGIVRQATMGTFVLHEHTFSCQGFEEIFRPSSDPFPLETGLGQGAR